MKRRNNLYETIDVRNILDIYETQIRRNTKNKYKLRKFEDFYTANMALVKNVFDAKAYEDIRYNIFLIKDPKYRIVMSQDIKDKLINHVMANILIEVLEPSLIITNVATRKEKGTHFGIKYLKKYLNELKDKPIYALKFDISKYFYSIDHEKLKEMLQKKIKDKVFLDVLFTIIDSTDKGVNDDINFLKQKEIERIKTLTINNKNQKISEVNNIPLYDKGKGLPIGSMTSQIMAIFYLNDVDHFIKEKLHCKYYIRYMDDGVLLSNDKEYLKKCLVEIRTIIKEYKLNLNKKTGIINVSKCGIEFLGFRFYIWNNKVVMKVKNQTKKRFKRKMKRIKKGKFTEEKARQIISSYMGHFKWGNCYNLFKKGRF